MRIGVLFPSRERPKKFFSALSKMLALSSGDNQLKVYAVHDLDDNSINEYRSLTAELYSRAEIHTVVADRVGKVGAINRCVRDTIADKQEIVLVMSDDMECVQTEWDRDIVEQAKRFGLDNSFFFSDGFTYPRLNTMPIVGIDYLKRFNYIYHPSYESLWADNEFTEVSRSLKKSVECSKVLFKHMHPLNDYKVESDVLYFANDHFNKKDQQNYLLRKSQKWPT